MGFFDKLKGAVKEEPAEEAPKEKIKRKTAAKPKAEKLKIKSAVTPEEKEEKEELKKAAPEGGEPRPEKSGRDSDFEGELAIDVYETDNDFYIQSTIAGVKPEDLDITIEKDILTIRGSRQKQAIENTKKHYYQECYWGSFSRQVILPEEVDGSNADASMKDGVLTLKIPKIIRIQKHKIKVA